MSLTCLYFAYGSNLLEKRMHLLNPNAFRRGKGILKDHVLEFGGYGKFWDCSPASITRKVGKHVWGAVWEIPIEDLHNLDRQENSYYSLTVEIETPGGEKLQCRTYKMIENFDEVELNNLPENRRPSKAYLETIIKGAEETGLPSEYINFLKSIPTNNSTHVPNLER